MSASLSAEHVTAIVPCHRDAPSPTLLDAIRTEVGQLVVVLDRVDERQASALIGGASAGTYEILALIGRTGKGSAVAAAIEMLLAREPAPSAIVVVDADGQHPPEAIPAFIAAAAKAELVIGDRFDDLDRMPFARRFANVLTAGLLSLATGARVRDSQCGMRLLRGRALHDFPPPAGGYEAETRHLRACLRNGVAVSWVRVPAIYDGESSAFRPLRDGLRILRACVR